MKEARDDSIESLCFSFTFLLEFFSCNGRGKGYKLKLAERK